MYYDLLAKIKNALRARKETFLTPFSVMDFDVAKILVHEHYLKDAQKKAVGRRNFLEIKLAYTNDQPTLNDFKIVSKPRRHLYRDYRSLRPVKQGYGIGILSTSQGIMSTKDAHKRKLGGEYLFEVW